ncbi:MAG: SMI1/KNR4 family protein [Spirochaetales bacterium]|nr:SMI1/KNR4 family protein [Spirochaetales bacterium]
MSNNVKWFVKKKDISDKEIIKVENIFNIRFPEDYRECVKINNGGAPKPEAYDFKDHKEAVFEWLLNFNEGLANNIIKTYNAIKDRLVDNIYPFASDPFGNYICFDYREDKKAPKIVFWDHEVASRYPEDAISYICDSFSELLDKLYEPDD